MPKDDPTAPPVTASFDILNALLAVVASFDILNA